MRRRGRRGGDQPQARWRGRRRGRSTAGSGTRAGPTRSPPCSGSVNPVAGPVRQLLHAGADGRGRRARARRVVAVRAGGRARAGARHRAVPRSWWRRRSARCPRSSSARCSRRPTCPAAWSTCSPGGSPSWGRGSPRTPTSTAWTSPVRRRTWPSSWSGRRPTPSSACCPPEPRGELARLRAWSELTTVLAPRRALTCPSVRGRLPSARGQRHRPDPALPHRGRPRHPLGAEVARGRRGVGGVPRRRRRALRLPGRGAARGVRPHRARARPDRPSGVVARARPDRRRADARGDPALRHRRRCRRSPPRTSTRGRSASWPRSSRWCARSPTSASWTSSPRCWTPRPPSTCCTRARCRSPAARARGCGTSSSRPSPSAGTTSSTRSTT